MTHSSCVVCGGSTDAFLCGDDRAGTGCLDRLMQHLGDSAWLVDQLNTTLARLDKVGGASVGFVSNGGDEQPLPLNVGAMEAGTNLRDHLCSWARDLWESNAARDEDGAIPALDLEPAIVPVSRWLMRHPTWVKLHPAADELYVELMEHFGKARRAIDRAPGKVYVGQCSSVDEGTQVVCEEDLYAREGEDFVRCQVCGVTHIVSERRKHLAGAVERQYVSIGLVVGLVTGRGHRLTSSVIRNLKARGRIKAYVQVYDEDEDADNFKRDAYGFRVRPHREGDERESLYLVSEVIEAITVKRYQREAS